MEELNPKAEAEREKETVQSHQPTPAEDTHHPFLPLPRGEKKKDWNSASNVGTLASSSIFLLIISKQRLSAHW